MGIVLTVSDLSFAYEGGKSVWTDISLEVHAGEVLSILGPNGTGKSTLLRCMAGLHVPSVGQVSIEGRQVQKMSRKDVARAIAFVPQMHTPVFSFSALDVVVMGRTAHIGAFSSPSAKDYAISEQAMETLGISSLAHKSYDETSGGERQLILFARALAQEARILLLDEPTSHLDFGNQARTLVLVRKLADQGLAVVMTTHFPDHALGFSERTALIADGRLQGYGRTESVLNSEKLSDLYGLPVDVFTLEAGEKVCIARAT
ncbi:iron complex transport system ATP-binding protein [Maridesulfovibrio ferrireducens]|uniref:Iron complex transport system ATP-binding protein n=1 Tax=Maridesulfovibrio ferrireducens TaxID=246191 RepID=A0A1G9CAK0_9BACT|nr:ABC transporter ATP-binding protein [Maridesulfovibrio ferrireducens]SDK48671.1 iron complex transport system ATP-binding protein [Maridesulfovibrio ferrireducens]